ncbi:MAG: hypothetical protein P8X65_13715 [Syntrophobacterales bacterium]|jgi:hypothetical protein
MDHYLRNLGWMLLLMMLAFTLGCAQTQQFMKTDSARVSQEEKSDFSISPQGAGEQTDWMMYQEDEGGGP